MKRESRFGMIFILYLFIFSILLFHCSQGPYVQGQHFPEWAHPGGIGTLLFFYMENMELYQSQNTLFDETPKIEQLINRLKVDINLLREEYPFLRTEYIDISQKRHLAINHLVYNIPTIIIFDKMGFEVRRWIPQDYERGGGSMWEMKRTIKKINILETDESGEDK